MFKNIFRSDGIYLGFIKDDFLFSRDGVYMGWVEGTFVWDKNGNFRGLLENKSGVYYILLERYTILPTPRTPKISPNTTPPNPPGQIQPITLPPGVADGFSSHVD